jgi:hypothetical protein
MMAAVLQVLRDRKEAMTCPELIAVMETEDLWVSPGGKTVAKTLYGISRDIKVNGKESAVVGQFQTDPLPTILTGCLHFIK